MSSAATAGSAGRHPGRSVQDIVHAAGVLARQRGDAVVVPAHVIAALLQDPVTARLAGVTPASGDRPARIGPDVAAALRAAVDDSRSSSSTDELERFVAALRIGREPGPEGVHGAASSGGLTAVAVPTMPDAAPTEVVDRVLALLARRAPSFVLLVATDRRRSAVVVDAVAHRLAHGPAPSAVLNRALMRVARPVAASSLGGRLRALADRVGGSLPVAPVIHVPDAQAAIEAPGGADAIATLVESGVPVIGETDVDGAVTVSRSFVLRAAVTTVDVGAASATVTAAVARAQAPAIASHHGVAVEEDVAESAALLGARFGLAGRFPDAALDALEDAAARASAAGRSAVTQSDVHAVIRGPSGGTHLGDRAKDLRDLEVRLHERIVGQHRAVSAVAHAIRRAETGVTDPDRPVGSFLFSGPTGVGKTELAKTLASSLFADEAALLRLDMGEYQEAHSVARLVGAPPGYVGYGHGGMLTEPLRRRPYSVVLLDEIEKANTAVLNTLLAVLDEGRLTDGSGSVVDARHCVVIMTSNLGSRVIGDSSLTDEQIEGRVRAAVAGHFPPEFVGRLDEVVVFRRLSGDDLLAIVDLQLKRLLARLSDRGVSVTIDEDARAWLADQGRDPARGARPLRAAIRRHVEDVIATGVLDGAVRAGAAVKLVRASDTLVIADDVRHADEGPPRW